MGELSLFELTAPIFNIQPFSIHDGPGIRVTVFEKGCPLRCRWCANPESNSVFPQLMTYETKCVGCGKCVAVCPEGAIRTVSSDGKQTTLTDRQKCIDCGRCIPVCPADAREISGRTMNVREVLDKVLADKLFLDESGGGMTISGGECLMHPDFTETLLRAAQEAGIHTAVESCSYASRETIDRVYRYVDLGLLDIKHMDSSEHKRLTGVPNERILENIRHIYHDLKVKTIIRVPIIPECNDSDDNISQTALFVARQLSREVEMHLLPYHRMGEGKNRNLGREMDLSVEIPSEQHMQHLKHLAESFGLRVQIGG